jgi:hypothetical protein
MVALPKGAPVATELELPRALSRLERSGAPGRPAAYVEKSYESSAARPRPSRPRGHVHRLQRGVAADSAISPHEEAADADGGEKG